MICIYDQMIYNVLGSDFFKEFSRSESCILCVFLLRFPWFWAIFHSTLHSVLCFFGVLAWLGGGCMHGDDLLFVTGRQVVATTAHSHKGMWYIHHQIPHKYRKSM